MLVDYQNKSRVTFSADAGTVDVNGQMFLFQIKQVNPTFKMKCQTSAAIRKIQLLF